MLLYLSSNQNIGIFDFIAKEQGILIKKLSGEFNLKQFVLRDMRNLSHCTYIAIDLRALKDTEDELIEAITAFKSMYDSRIIIYAEGFKQGNFLLEKLVENDIYNIVTAISIDKIQSEILKCLSSEGMNRQDAMRFRNEISGEELINKYTFICENIQIAVFGVASKVGTTTTAINLANYLAFIGAKVCYVEANKNNHLDEIASFYKSMVRNDDSYKYMGVTYYNTSAQFSRDYHCIIYDIGELTKEKRSILRSCNINILCGTSKPYEISTVKDMLGIIEGLPVNIFLSFVPENSKLILKNMFDSKSKKVYFPNYTPDLFDSKNNENIYKETLKDYINEN